MGVVWAHGNANSWPPGACALMSPIFGLQPSRMEPTVLPIQTLQRPPSNFFFVQRFCNRLTSQLSGLQSLRCHDGGGWEVWPRPPAVEGPSMERPYGGKDHEAGSILLDQFHPEGSKAGRPPPPACLPPPGFGQKNPISGPIFSHKKDRSSLLFSRNLGVDMGFFRFRTWPLRGFTPLHFTPHFTSRA